MSSFYSSSHHQQSNVSSNRYPSYLLKVAPPQSCSNFDSNYTILVPKIANKYHVKKNSNTVRSNIHCVDILSVKSSEEFNDTTSMKPTGNEIKITNKATDDNNGMNSGFSVFDSPSYDSFGSYQLSTIRVCRHPSYLMNVSPPQVWPSIENMLMQKDSKMYGLKKSSFNLMYNSQHRFDEVSIESSLRNVKIHTDQNSNEINSTNKSIDVNQDNCLTLTTDNLKTDSVMKTENGINCDNQEEFENRQNEIKLIKICRKCHKGWHVDKFAWKKVSKTDKIKLLEIIEQNSKTEKPIPFLANYPIITFNNNSEQNLSINKTKLVDKI